MGPFRVLQISIVVLMLFGSTWLVRAVGMAASPTDGSRTWLGSSDALAVVLQQGDNGHNGDDADDNGNTNNDDDDGGDDNDSDDNDNFDDLNDRFPTSPSASEPRHPPEPRCSTPDQETAFTSRDEKVAVRIFGSSRPVRIEIYRVIDYLAAPLPPGTLVGLLAYEIRASSCDTNPLLELPAEASLAIRYSDVEATGLDENRFVIGRLDLATGTWSPVENRANDSASNATTATISQTGFYMVWESR